MTSIYFRNQNHLSYDDAELLPTLPKDLANIVLDYVASMLMFELKQILHAELRKNIYVKHLHAFHKCCLVSSRFCHKYCLACIRYMNMEES